MENSSFPNNHRGFQNRILLFINLYIAFRAYSANFIVPCAINNKSMPSVANKTKKNSDKIVTIFTPSFPFNPGGGVNSLYIRMLWIFYK